MEKTYKALSEKYKNVYLSFDKSNNDFIDFSSKIDIVCSANPYDNMTDKLYSISKFCELGILSIYINYGYPAIKWAKKIAETEIFSLMWKIFTESEYITKEYSTSMKNRGKNLVLSGYMKMDALANQKKIKRKRKKIIIAPHHTIEESCKDIIGLSNFLTYFKFFKELPKLYPQIDFVFRPHPLLKTKLEKKEFWGKEKTEKYFKDIQNYPNLEYQNGGDYFETFANSDGIIHDCSSFLAEYMFTENPACYILSAPEAKDKYFLDNGKKIIEHCYEAYSKDDICSYIENVILNEKDYLKEKRINFIRKELYLNYPNVTNYVIKYIKSELTGEKI